MLHKILILVLAVATPFAEAVAQQHAAALPLGLKKLTWGVTIRAAERAFPGLYSSDRDHDPNIVELRIDHFPLDGCDFSLLLEFYRGSLNEIGLAAIHNIQACANQVKADLSVKYGPGKETHVPDLGVYDTDWHRPTGDVRYQENEGFNPRYAEKHLSVSFWRPNAYFRPIP